MAFENFRQQAAAERLKTEQEKADKEASKTNPLGWLQPVLSAAGGVVGAVYGGPAGASAGAAAGGALGGGISSLTDPKTTDAQKAVGATKGVASAIGSIASATQDPKGQDKQDGWARVMDSFHSARLGK